VSPWEVYDYPFPWGSHPAVVVSNRVRCERKPEVVVLACRSLRPGPDRAALEHEVILNGADGLDGQTLCRCDLLFTVPKAELRNRRGVVSTERQRLIARRIVQGLAIAGL
jgi:mRNA-degrading endonuclease toxin of MazEF toxin-antitoxin module